MGILFFITSHAERGQNAMHFDPRHAMDFRAAFTRYGQGFCRYSTRRRRAKALFA
jgi:hypothetical protein